MGGLAESYVGLLLAWDGLTRAAGGPQIVDFDLSGVTPSLEVSDELEVLAALEALAGDAPADDFLGRRLAGHIAYLRHKLGEQTALAKYCFDTQGFRAAEFPEAELAYRRELATESLSRFGTAIRPELLEDLQRVDPAVEVESVPRAIRAAVEEMRPTLEAVLGRTLQFDYDVELVEERAYWVYWADSSCGRFRLRFNRWHDSALTQSRIRQFAAHEVLGHFGQIHSYARRVAAGELPATFGVTTLHTLEQFALEGTAQTLPLWLWEPRDIEELLLARVRLAHYMELVRHNAHIMINSGQRIEQCVGYVAERLPHLEIDKVLVDLVGRARNPSLRSYQLAYGVSFDAMVRATEALPARRRASVVRRLYAEPLPYPEFAETVAVH